MQEPEPFPLSEKAEPAGPWSSGSVGSGAERETGDPPTVRTGSSARRARGDIVAGPPLPLPQPGDRIDSFELEEAIGVGGMGAVFRALDTRLDRHVALKILPPEQASDPEVVQRFYQEGRAAARLDNENIARVYTIDHDVKYHFIAFEYIEGITIRQRVERNGPLPVAEAINFTLQIAGALVHASERGVVHRDIKPSNIIITPQGRAKLVDMGLARRFERGGDDGLTQSGMTLGTFDYISPEQARDPRDVDVRSDLYSLGCTLFHMLTGRPPFPEGTVLQKLLQHQEDPPPDVRALNPAVPPDLANILVKLMAKDRDRRYQAPEQLVRDLLTVAGALGLRSVSPEGLVWMSATHPAGWEHHLVWALPTLALAVVVCGLVWWGQEPTRPVAESYPKVTSQRPPAAQPPLVERRGNEPPRVSDHPVATSAAPVESRPRRLAVDSSEDLLASLSQAPARSLIVLTDDGPYQLGGVSTKRALAHLVDRDLTIKAAEGVHPVLQFARETATGIKAAPAMLDLVRGHVTLEGLEFDVGLGNLEDGLAVIRAEDTELTIRRCVFRKSTVRGRHGRLVALQVRMHSSSDRPPAVFIEACHFDGGQVGILAQGPADLVLRDCTLAGGGEPSVWLENANGASSFPAELHLRHVSLFAGEGPVFRFDGTAPRVWIDDSVISPTRDSEGTLVASDDPDGLEWRGRTNLYARIGTYLKPLGARAGREPIRSWSSWSDSLVAVRETGSAMTRGRIWEESDPLQILVQQDDNPTRAFRLAATRPGAADVGTRQGPSGIVVPPSLVQLAANVANPRREVPTTPRIATEANPTSSVERAPQPMTGSPPMPEPPASKPKTGSEMPEMPVMPPMGIDEPATMPEDAVPASRPAEIKPVETGNAKTADANPDPMVLRTADQFLNALSRPEARGGTLRLAADADWELPSVRIQGEVRWVLRAEPGPTRPRIRFRPGPVDPKTPTAWSSWIELRSGALLLEGIDLVLAEADAPRQGRWAGFGVWGGADLGLTNCTVTIQGAQTNSAAVVIPGVENEGPGATPPTSPSAALVRMTDSLLRSGGELFEVASGRRLDLELSNAVVSTGGSLVRAHGLPRGQEAEPLKLTLSQVTARTAGGLILLESAPSEPDLPVADVRARDSIFATTPQGAPLFRVDGQDTLTALRDRIKWEGHGVAYHEINAYRRDQSAQVGAVPNIYDRTSWMVAVGTKEDAPVHGNVRFLKKWDPDRDAWTLNRDDVRLAPESPASRAGADLARVPDAPIDES